MTGLLLVQTAAEQLAAAREGLDTPLLPRLMGLVGIGTMLAIAWGLSVNRRRVNWRLIGMGVGLQGLFGFLVLKTVVGRALFAGANKVFTQLLGFTEQGARFIFGNLVKNNVPVGIPSGADPAGGPIAATEVWASTGTFFAFSVLPTIIFFSALMSVLYHSPVLRVLGAKSSRFFLSLPLPALISTILTRLASMKLS